ncbi:MAG: type III secretion system chaperone [Verrucomicrobia bacterium]|nr:type III secretion system chaperone [Verrucomicrobiota bacterium]
MVAKLKANRAAYPKYSDSALVLKEKLAAMVTDGRPNQKVIIADHMLRAVSLKDNGRLAVRSGPSFAVVPEVGSLLLQQRVPLAGLAYPDFERVWLSFIDTHEKSVAKLAQLTQRNAASEEVANDSELSLEDHHRLFLQI